jgi:exopolysaccharide biosynthesis polyprenyl glycosylphosphotransferase
VDLGAIALAREILQGARRGVLGPWAAAFANALLADPVVSGREIAVAVLASLFFLECYRADLWRDPVRIWTAVGVGVGVALYSQLWTVGPATAAFRALVVWLALGAIMVTVRMINAKISYAIPRPGIHHRVLEIHTANGPVEPLGLGSKYRTVAVLTAASLPDDLEDMEGWLDGGVDTIVLAGELPPGRFGQLTDFAITHGCQLLILERSVELVGLEPRRIWVKGIPLFEVTAPGLRASQVLFKRTLDIVAGLLLLVLFAPVMLALALAVKLDSPGPVFFRQRRAGLGGRFFPLLKFRSMRADAEAVLRSDPVMYQRYLDNDFKLPEDEDPRVTRLGRFLRRTSLDELPQLLNVLLGQMSLVGPRPVVEPELEMYRGRIPTLLSVKPGLTGRWQISGRSAVAFPERAELDLEYVRRWSILEDLWILLMTVPAVLLRRGAH